MSLRDSASRVPLKRNPPSQEVRTFTFNVAVGLLTGNDTVFLKINDPGVTDGFSIDYSQLTVAMGAPVPEPETYALMLGGLALLGAVARRRRG